jgi:WD40 repeat protein
MTGQEALTIIDHLLAKNQQNTLKDIQSAVILQVWERNSYQKIGEELGYDADYIKQIAAQLWQLLSGIFGTKVAKSNFQAILQRYQRSLNKTNWGEAIDVSYFYGRQNCLQILQNWIIDSHCRVVGILGWGGIGKTALSVKIAQQLESQFEYVVWRSLRHAPTPSNLLNEILPILTGSEVPESSITSLMEQLRQKRCLLVFDNIESILQPGHQNGSFLAGYEEYGQLFERVSDEKHQSCLVITSREKPNGMTLREGSNLPVRSLQLNGLPVTAAQYILIDKGITASLLDQEKLINYVDGNPLALKLIATTIQNLFNGDIQSFLAQKTAVFGNLWTLLDQQFERLSTLQQQIMYWLAINRESVRPHRLQAELCPSTTLLQLLESLETLRDRSLIETTEGGLTQQPVIMEYVIERFIRQIEQEIITGQLQLFKTHALIEAQTQDYLRDAQIQLILQPLVDRLSVNFLHPTQLQNHLIQILESLRYQAPSKTGYAGGNLLNVFCYLQIDLQGYDFSSLAIRQAYLSHAILHDVNFTNSQVSQTVFADTFGGVVGIVFSPNGQYLATSDTKGNIQIWDAATLANISHCQGHLHWTWAVDFSPDGRYLVSASDDYRVKLWDVLTGECLSTYSGHTLSVNAVSFSPDGQTIASSSQDNTIRLWRVFPGQLDPEIRTLVGHTGRVWSIAYSPDSQTLVSSGEDCEVRLWDVLTGSCLAHWKAHKYWIRSIAFSPDGRSIATGSHDRQIKIWDLATQECLTILRGHQNIVSKVAYSPDGQQLVSSSFDQTIKLWDLDTGSCLKTLMGHRSIIWNVAFHPDGQQIASAGDDHTTKIWNLKLGRCINTIVGYTETILSITLSPDGRYLASGHENRITKVWDIHTGQVIQVLRGHSNRVWSVKFSPNGYLLASGSADYTINLYDWQSGHCLQILRGHTSWVWRVVFSPDGQTLVSSSYDQTIKIWDVTTGKCLKTITAHTSSVVAVAFSPDGHILASGATDGSIKLFQTNNLGECYQNLQEHTNSVWSVAFSTDGQWLISSSYDETIKLWSVVTGKCLRTFTGNQGGVLTIQFSPDNRLIISGGIDGNLNIWDVQSGQLLKTLTGHRGLIHAIEVGILQLPGIDEPTLLAFSGSLDETIKVWDLNTAKCLATWKSLRPYEGMKIDRLDGLTPAQKATLLALGGVINNESSIAEVLETQISASTYLFILKAIFWGKYQV